MQLTNAFEVAVSPDELWELLTDIERIAPALPGFKLTGCEGTTCTGTMTVKVGAVSVTYNATMEFVEQDDTARRAVIHAEGRETRGQGRASAVITASVEAAGSGAKATMVTDFTVTGRVAQFGRGVMADVSNRLVAQFVKGLEKQLVSSEPEATAAPAAGASTHDAATAPRPEADGEEPVNLMSVAAVPVLKRVAPLLVLAAAFLIWRARR